MGLVCFMVAKYLLLLMDFYCAICILECIYIRSGVWMRECRSRDLESHDTCFVGHVFKRVPNLTFTLLTVSDRTRPSTISRPSTSIMTSRRQPLASTSKGAKGLPAISRPASALSRVPLNEAKEKKTSSCQSEEEGSSIQVAIRCRRRSTKEVDEKSPAIVSFSKEPEQAVTVELASVTSTFGVVNLPPTRTYPFDTVFGPDADQATIYNEVVSPMLEEVLQGYNCTLFAYGQTGTGKT